LEFLQSEDIEVADEKILSQRLFDQLVELLRNIRDSAAQRGDTATYGHADRADALLRSFVEASRIGNETPEEPNAENEAHVRTVVELAGPAMEKARAVLREHENWYIEHSLNT
jgi:hypothetical protein